MQFEFGITDRSPSRWKRAAPIWEDETLEASSSQTFLDLMNSICENAIKYRREYDDDYGIDAHLWKLEIMSESEATNPNSNFRGDDDDEDDDGEGRILVMCPEEASQLGSDDELDEYYSKVLSCDTKLDAKLLPKDTVIAVTYDYGDATTIFLKVLNVKAN
jgi:hypothetical protein